MLEQLHAGLLRGLPNGLASWHSRGAGDDLVYWIGMFHERTPVELYRECITILADLSRNHPGIERAALYSEESKRA